MYPFTPFAQITVERLGVKTYAMLDWEDVPKTNGFYWYVGNRGYAIGEKQKDKKKTRVLLHRLLLGCAPGDGKMIDHINRDKLDCRRKNLRFANKEINSRNRVCRYGEAKMKGVSRVTGSSTWRALGSHEGKYIHLGCFKTKEEADAVAKEWRLKNHPESGD